MTFGSLFAGIGGIDLGFERAGLTCKWQVEIDDYATQILSKHWPGVHRERDIRECGQNNLERVDVIAGGFPCQDLSYAGRGAGLDGQRSGLFFEAIRLVRQLQPRAVVLENVAALLTRGLDRVLGSLAEIGFDAEWHCISAASVGAPHIRDRIFIFAYRQGEPSRALHAAMAELSVAMGNTNRRDRKRRSATGQQGQTRPAARHKEVDAANTKEPRLERAESARDSRSIGLAGQSGPRGWQTDWWSAEPAVGELVNGVSDRLVRFAGRTAYGMPNRVNKLRCLGNAVVPQVAEVVARLLLSRLEIGN